MKFFAFLKRNKDRINRAEMDALEAERERRAVEARWPEVRERANWARTAPDVDVLTALFTSLGGKP